MGSARQTPIALGSQTRIMVPVMAAAGGSGRSTVAGLLACGLAAVASSAVLDTGSRLTSPWSGWATAPGAGLAALPPGQPLTAGHVRAAAAHCAGPSGSDWQVLTDHRPWNSAPLGLPRAPEAWHQLAAIGGWQAVVADTTHPVAQDIVTARSAGHGGLTARWCSLPLAVPVLCATASGSGVAALQTAVMAAAADGLPLKRTLVALVATGEGRMPGPVRAALTMLEPKVGRIVLVPADSRIRSHGLHDAPRLKPASLRAARDLAAAVVQLAHSAWGDPLPAAAVPAPFRPEGTSRVPAALGMALHR